MSRAGVAARFTALPAIVVVRPETETVEEIRPVRAGRETVKKGIRQGASNGDVGILVIVQPAAHLRSQPLAYYLSRCHVTPNLKQVARPRRETEDEILVDKANVWRDLGLRHTSTKP